MKRFVITIGDSRTGKSTVSRLLIDLYREKKLKPRIFYHGYRNKLSMYSSYFNITHMGFSRGDSDRLLADLEIDAEIDVVLTDMPGQNFVEFKNFEEDVNLLKNLESLGYKVTFLHPISHRSDCFKDYLQEVVSYFSDRADYIVVKNQYFGREFSSYEASTIKNDLELLNGTEVVLGKLNQVIYNTLEETSVTYSAAVQTDLAISLIQKSIIFHWMTNFYSGLSDNMIASEYLGLSTKLALFEEMDSKI